MKRLRKRDDLSSQFFVTAAKRGVAEEAAELLFQFDQAASFRELVKRLKKIEPSDDAIGTMNATLKKKASADWLDDPFTLYGMLGVLVKDSSDALIATVAKVANSLNRLAEDETVANPTEHLVELLDEYGEGARADALTAKLKGVETKRQRAGESVALAKRLGLSFADKPKWRAKIWLATGEPNPWFGAYQKGPQICLRLSPTDKPDWELELRGQKKGIYSNWGGDVSQDDFRLPPLTALDEFPAWLVTAGKKLKVRFSVDDAVIDCGRHKKAANALRAWLAASR